MDNKRVVLQSTHVDEGVDKTLGKVFDLLLDHYGPQHWWPADDPFEVIIGAILTQSTAWRNVEKAIANLKVRGLLSPEGLMALSIHELAELIRSSGYYNAKAAKIKSFLLWFKERHDNDLNKLAVLDVSELRQQLLMVKGIGEETADSIILYALDKPIFVIDAYTRRVVSRLGIAPLHDRYEDYQKLFMNHLPCDVAMFNEYHALLVRHGKEICKKQPVCEGCYISSLCRHFAPV